VQDGRFMLGGRPYYFVGANFWQGMNLGMQGQPGNREQLLKELDDMQALGITNLRVMAASEGPNTEPYRIIPALMTSPGVYDAAVFDGLDFFLAEMGKRDMRAVMVLNNYWYWSGGMAQYVSWNDGTPIPYPGDWNAYMNYSAQFYSCDQCQEWYRAHIETLITRTNSYTGKAYRYDPTIFSWELANEPRRYPYDWINSTAAYIKSLDPNHLVTTGSEGTPPGETLDFKTTHASPNIDYVTIHIWPQNWGWYDPDQPATYSSAEQRAVQYLDQHAKIAVAIKKPLVLEEFGLARDGGGDIYNLSTPTITRERYYQALYNEVEALISRGSLVGGDNFWAWAGSARPGNPWVGDPPHESPGWYSVYDTDYDTQAVIRKHASQMQAFGQ
jgi:mannan endo-1,4-beta-mannosidase